MYMCMYRRFTERDNLKDLSLCEEHMSVCVGTERDQREARAVMTSMITKF